MRTSNPPHSVPRWASAPALALIAASCVAPARAQAPLPTPAELLDRMVADFSPKIPPDVDTALQKAFDAQKRFAETQLLFDIDSWQSFVALCWPTGDNGAPAFDLFPTDADVFDPKPEAGAKRGVAPNRNRRYIEDHKLAGVKPGDRVLVLISSTKGGLKPNVERPSEVEQAFSTPLWDQNGMMVRYEIRLNDEEREYILSNGLDTLDGQAAFSKACKVVQFPSGTFGGAATGAIELKLGWKVLGPNDDSTRFLATDAKIVVDPLLGTTKDVKIGLIGMHIAHKTTSSPQWIWSTFLHVDSLDVDPLEDPTHPRQPLFNNPNRPTAPVNTPSQSAPPYYDGKEPTQVQQVTPIPLATQRVNRKAREKLRAMKSPLQFYDLLNTQWPTDPAAKPTPVGPSLGPDGITNKSGGRPTPVYLVNPLFETYFQLGNQQAGGLEEGSPANNTGLVFGTESCMGCHSSAGVAFTPNPGSTSSPFNFGPQLSGDFSWLLQTKAQPKPK